MTQSVAAILAELGTKLTEQIGAAERRAEVAEASYAKLCKQLGTLAGFAANDGYSPPTEAASDVAVAQGRRKDGPPACYKSLSDAEFLAALSVRWRSAHDIRKVLIASGYKPAYGTVYARMEKLQRAHSTTIEETSNPRRWRRRSNEPDCSETLPDEKVPSAAITRVRERLTSAPTPKRFHLPKLVQGDCFGIMDGMPEQSVDLILADPPYGTTKLPIDPQIDVSALWAAYRRIIKPTGTIILFGSQPFSSSLVAAAPDLFKHDLIWIKNHATGSLHARNRPLKQHEDILVFSSGTTIQKSRSKRRYTYNPLGQEIAGTKIIGPRKDWGYLHKITDNPGLAYEATRNCPRTALYCSKESASLHPFQKPLALLEYLIRTYSNEGDVVLDSFMGAGSTCIAAMRSGRQSIGIELEQTYFEAASVRSAEAWQAEKCDRSRMRVATLADFEENALAA